MDEMKNIHILYSNLIDKTQKQKASQYSDILKKAGYTTELFCLNSRDDTARYMDKAKPDACQLIVSLNMAGYNLSTTGNCSSMNHLTMNIVNLIDCSPELFTFNLKQRMNFTMSFIFSSGEDAEYVKKNFPHIRNVLWVDSFTDFLPGYLEELDWRY